MFCCNYKFSDECTEGIDANRIWLAVTSEFSRDGHSQGDDAVCIPHVSGSSCSRLLSEFHILSEIGRGAFGDVIKVL